MVKPLLTISDVARCGGVSTQRVRQLDDVLQPIRQSNRYRRYDPSVVEQWLATRTAK